MRLISKNGRNDHQWALGGIINYSSRWRSNQEQESLVLRAVNALPGRVPALLLCGVYRCRDGESKRSAESRERPEVSRQTSLPRQPPADNIREPVRSFPDADRPTPGTDDHVRA